MQTWSVVPGSVFVLQLDAFPQALVPAPPSQETVQVGVAEAWKNPSSATNITASSTAEPAFFTPNAASSGNPAIAPDGQCLQSSLRAVKWVD